MRKFFDCAVKAPLSVRAWNVEDFSRLPDHKDFEYATATHFVKAAFGQRRAISYDGRRIVDSVEKGMELRDRATGARLKSFQTSDPVVTAVELSHDNQRLAVATLDGVITIFDVDSGRELAHRQPHANKVYTMAFNSDDSRLASGGDDSVIHIADAATLDVRLTLRGHTSYVHALTFTPEDRALVSGSGDMTVRLWSAQIPPP